MRQTKAGYKVDYRFTKSKEDNLPHTDYVTRELLSKMLGHPTKYIVDSAYMVTGVETEGEYLQTLAQIDERQ